MEEPQMPRTAVYLYKEDPLTSQASHSATNSVLALVLGDGAGVLATVNGHRVLKLKTTETWRQLKDRLKPRGGNKNCPRLKPAQAPRALDLSYPEKNRESGRHPHEAMRRECLRAQAQKKGRQRTLAQAPGDVSI